MRISSLQIFNIANGSMAKSNQELVKTQEQLSSGKRVNRPSDDPVAATKIMSLSAELASLDQFNKNIDIATNNLNMEETTLNGVNNIITRIQELAVQAGNTATLTQSEYKSIAAEVDTRLDELKNLLNSKNANGDYIFGGYKSTQPPFQGSAQNGFSYEGDEGQHYIKISSSTTIAASDSGKKIFVDVQSENHTVHTYASTSNQSDPPAQISVGQIVDQAEFDEFYPKDMVVTFNADNAISPPGKNFTITERSTGRVVLGNERFVAGQEVEVNGVSFRLSGAPVSGGAATPATRNFGADVAATFPQTFAAPNNSVRITVAGRSETLTLTGTVNNASELATMINANNSAALTALGVTVNDSGFTMPSGVDFRINGGSAVTDSAFGLNTAIGTNSVDGELATPGDRLFIDSTDKQDILTTFARFSEAMKSFDGSNEGRDALSDIVASTISNLGHAQTSVLEVTSAIGGRINTLESTTTLHLDAQLVTETVLSELRDIDYAEAATRLSTQSLILQAAQSAFIRVSQLSLVNQL
ncbi:Flagellar hook-associated protein 3 [Thalassocella blandensis]|nr:Flagellar hook-associated protein 3 [Thalassocella blandensis]